MEVNRKIPKLKKELKFGSEPSPHAPKGWQSAKQNTGCGSGSSSSSSSRADAKRNWSMIPPTLSKSGRCETLLTEPKQQPELTLEPPFIAVQIKACSWRRTFAWVQGFFGRTIWWVLEMYSGSKQKFQPWWTHHQTTERLFSSRCGTTWGERKSSSPRFCLRPTPSWRTSFSASPTCSWTR